MKTKITLLDYGMCNLLNVARAFQFCGAEVIIAEDSETVKNAEKLVVPGVGAFADSMHSLQTCGFDDAIRKFISTERPFLGICVGMQILFDSSQEFGFSQGLGLLPGVVESIPTKTVEKEIQRIPHIGWNQLLHPQDSSITWKGTVLEGLENQEAFMYFIHSFAAIPQDTQIRLANVVYGGHLLCAAIKKNNIMATQFHPERSGKLGLNILKKFICM